MRWIFRMLEALGLFIDSLVTRRCPECGGNGVFVVVQDEQGNPLTIPCPCCHGTGRI